MNPNIGNLREHGNRYGLWLRKTLPSVGQKGFLLIGLVFVITFIAILGGGMLYFTTTSTYGELFGNHRARAYYLGESGGNYARLLLQKNSSSYPSGTYNVTDNEQFILLSYDNLTDTSRIIIESTGVVNAGIWFSSRVKVRFDVSKISPTGVNPTSPVFFDANDDKNIDSTWNYDPKVAKMIDNQGPGEGPALQLKGEEGGLISLKWQNNPPAPDLLAAWNNKGGLLSYELQVKVKTDLQGNKGRHYMLGLSFRLNTKGTSSDQTDDDSYGVSFFRSFSGDPANQKPDWIKSLAFSTFSTVSDGKIYIVLWKKINGAYTLLDYKQLTASDGVIEIKKIQGVDREELKDWSTIVVRMDEQFSGAGGARQNHIIAQVQGTGVYQRNITNNTVSWSYATFNPVLWIWSWSLYPPIHYPTWQATHPYILNNIVVPSPTGNGHCYISITPGTSDSSPPAWPTAPFAVVTDGTVLWQESTKIVDGTLTSQDFGAIKPDEIGIHAFYDSNAANDQLFDDFGLRVSGGGGIGVIQY